MGLGWRQDDHDERDYLYLGANMHMGAGMSAMPPTQAGIPCPARVYDQGATNACCGFAMRYAFETLVANRVVAAHNEPTPSFSSAFVYWNARQEHGESQHDGGTYLRSCLKSANKLGIASEALCPWEPERVNARPNWRAYRDAFAMRTRVGYARIFQHDEVRVRVIKQSIRAGHPVLVGLPVTERFMRMQSDEVTGRPTMAEVVGGHAMCIVGYNERGFEGPNSWGSAWGNGGWFTLSEEYVCMPEADLWSVYLRP